MQKRLLTGMSQVDITPPAPVSIRAAFYLIISERVESPLYANAFAVESGGEQLIICACDPACFDAASVERGGGYSAFVSSGFTGHIGGALLVDKTMDAIRRLWS